MVKRPKVAEKRSTGLCDLQNPSTPWFLLWLWYLRLFKSLNPASAPEVVSISASIDKYKFPYFHITHLTFFPSWSFPFSQVQFLATFLVLKSLNYFAQKRNNQFDLNSRYSFLVQNSKYSKYQTETLKKTMLLKILMVHFCQVQWILPVHISILKIAFFINQCKAT